ncbi:PAS domain S-box protein [Sphingomonas sp. Y38-1Y]|uniref:PAS domain S-box protein n=1 Tax=Sphingomonas sp. Y38-1Y TaxID=3078265 RepID=UPI0028EE61F9|nr:PAS domain S-box protein [Sphingomonas sp. Y38-1Y]
MPSLTNLDRPMVSRSADPRLSSLDSYAVLDTHEEAAFDDVALLASQICETPIALISFVDADRQWFKARLGIDAEQTPLCDSVCAHAIGEPELLVVPDLLADERTTGSALVTGDPNIRFYAGAVLRSPEGEALGTLCVIDHQPRPGGLGERQRTGLLALARQVMAQLELRRTAAAERSLRAETAVDRARYEAVFNSAVDYAIVVMDPDGRITDWNEGATRILGWAPDEICGQDLSAFFTPEDRAAGVPLREMDDALALGRGIDERWHLRRSGERFWANGEMMPLRDAESRAIGFVKVLRDRTEARLIQEQLALKDERLQMALSASGSVGLWDWMVESDLLHGDDNFARLYGLDVEHTAAGLTMEEYQEHVVPEDIAPLRERIRGVFERGEDFLVEYRLAIPGQTLRWVECKGRMVADADGRPHRFSGTAVDVTARKTAEEQKHLLMQELSHRVKNTFAMVQAVVFQTMRGADPELMDKLQSRLAALSRAHEVLLQESWSATTITALLDRVLRREAEGDRVELDGPEFEVKPDAALSLSLLLHEMATNATKYGALSAEDGRVSVAWRLEDGCFRLCWDERGGPPAQPPTRKGFGSKLIAMGVCGARRVDLEYGVAGLSASFEAKTSFVVQEQPTGA